MVNVAYYLQTKYALLERLFGSVKTLEITMLGNTALAIPINICNNISQISYHRKLQQF